MEIVSKENQPTQKVQIQFHGFGEKSKSFTVRGITTIEAFYKTLQYFNAIKDAEGVIEIKVCKKNGHPQN